MHVLSDNHLRTRSLFRLVGRTASLSRIRSRDARAIYTDTALTPDAALSHTGRSRGHHSLADATLAAVAATSAHSLAAIATASHLSLTRHSHLAANAAHTHTSLTRPSPLTRLTRTRR